MPSGEVQPRRRQNPGESSPGGFYIEALSIVRLYEPPWPPESNPGSTRTPESSPEDPNPAQERSLPRFHIELGRSMRKRMRTAEKCRSGKENKSRRPEYNPRSTRRLESSTQKARNQRRRPESSPGGPRRPESSSGGQNLAQEAPGD